MLLAALLQLIGAILFAIAFFPASQPSPSTSHNPPAQHPPPFDRLVFVLIDALRSDFMFGSESKMHFSQSLVRNGNALPYTALAQAPTVTLPRLKAITTGSNPQFLDAVLNIQPDSMDKKNIKILESSDSWLRQILFSNPSSREERPGVKRRALFYGDDTWLRLFPSEWFVEVDGVSSFFVSDTEIVDYNVTRHLDRVFSPIKDQNHGQGSLDWDIVILHYLGLDHVGHLAGSKSHLMAPKQQQLDSVIQRIFENISHFDSAEKRNSLLVVTGDHGMTDAGNHGGSSSPELSTALLFASPCFNHTTLRSTDRINAEVVQQVDIVPTLSMLFGTQIPSGSIGVAIQSVLNRSFTNDLVMRSNLVYHALQIINLVENVLGGQTTRELLGFNRTIDQAEAWVSLLSGLHLTQIHEILHQSQDYLMTHFSGYNLPKMVLGLAVMGLGTLLFTIQAIKQSQYGVLNRQGVLVLVLASLQILSVSSTSFIEEEHQSWFFFAASSFIFSAYFAPTNRLKVCYLLAATFVRVLRGWSDNGQQISSGNGSAMSTYLVGQPWLCHLLDPIGIYYLRHSLSSARFFGQGENLGSIRFDSSIGSIFLIAAGLLSLTPMNQSFLYLEKHSIVSSFFEHLVDHGFRARLMYTLLGIGLSSSILSNSTKLSKIYSLTEDKQFKLYRHIKLSILIMCRSLTKPENYIVLWISFFSSDLVQELRLASGTSPEGQVDDNRSVLEDGCSGLVSTWIELVFLKTTFFALGGSNSLATIDISNSFNGLTSFSLPISTMLTFVSNFSGPLIIALNNFPPQQNHKKPQQKKSLRCCFFSASLLFICTMSSFFLDHLFIFSVFSPAVLYSFAWFFALNILLLFFF